MANSKLAAAHKGAEFMIADEFPMRDYVAFMPKADAATVARNLAIAFQHYNEKHPHSALKYRSPRAFCRAMDSATLV